MNSGEEEDDRSSRPNVGMLPGVADSSSSGDDDSDNDSCEEPVFSNIVWEPFQPALVPHVISPNAGGTHSWPDQQHDAAVDEQDVQLTVAPQASTSTMHAQLLILPPSHDEPQSGDDGASSSPASPLPCFSWLAGASRRLADIDTPRSRTLGAQPVALLAGPDGPLPATLLSPKGPAAADLLHLPPPSPELLLQQEAELSQRFHAIVHEEKEVEARSHLLLEQDVAGIGISELDALIARLQAGPSWDLQATRPPGLPDPSTLFTDSDSDSEQVNTCIFRGSKTPAPSAMPRSLLPAHAAAPAPVPSLQPPSVAFLLPPTPHPASTQPPHAPQPITSHAPPVARPMPPRFKLFTGLSPSPSVPEQPAAATPLLVSSSASSAAAPLPTFVASRGTVVVDLRAPSVRSSTAQQAPSTTPPVAAPPAPTPVTTTHLSPAQPCRVAVGQTAVQAVIGQLTVGGAIGGLGVVGGQQAGHGHTSSSDEEDWVAHRRQFKASSGHPMPEKAITSSTHPTPSTAAALAPGRATASATAALLHGKQLPTVQQAEGQQHSIACGGNQPMPPGAPVRSMFVATTGDLDASDEAWTLVSYQQWVAQRAAAAAAVQAEGVASAVTGQSESSESPELSLSPTSTLQGVNDSFLQVQAHAVHAPGKAGAQKTFSSKAGAGKAQHGSQQTVPVEVLVLSDGCAQGPPQRSSISLDTQGMDMGLVPLTAHAPLCASRGIQERNLPSGAPGVAGDDDNDEGCMIVSAGLCIAMPAGVPIHSPAQPDMHSIGV